ncbi:hypothetical protein [Micromonospora sp. DPT]|uniref:hypothetical protein n=1 Tax=Micromonospora sp. DPT TaxID=3142975 RepID=UPI0032096AB4
MTGCATAPPRARRWTGAALGAAPVPRRHSAAHRPSTMVYDDLFRDSPAATEVGRAFQRVR